MKKLPISISTFSEIINENYLYIDKTADIYNLISSHKYMFLSRPRRFGKSLLLSTLEQIFLENRDLFKGLKIDQLDYPWKKYPIIKIDFSQIRSSTPEIFEINLSAELKKIAEYYKIDLKEIDVITQLNRLIENLAKTEKVAILIDEYDAPILRNLNEKTVWKKNRELLRDFYGAIKANDQYIHKLFVTGVTKVSQTSLFSGANNIEDISLLSPYQTIVGYTQEELNFYFKDLIDSAAKILNKNVSELKDEIKFWYNGYNFSETIKKVYNPFSILNFFAKAKSKPLNPFHNYWIETGTPQYLYETAKNNITELFEITQNLITDKPIEVENKNLTAFDPEYLPLETLLFQAGYLTISNFENGKYQLFYPNQEVKLALEEYLIESLFDKTLNQINPTALTMKRSLEYHDLDAFFINLQRIIAWLPYDILKDAYLEGFYHGIVQIIMQLLNVTIRSEDHTNIGRIDLVVEVTSYIYVMEFKIKEKDTAESALKQIEDNKYYEKYLDSRKIVVLVGAKFHKFSNKIDWVEKELK